MDSSSYRLSSRHFAKRKYLGEGGFGKVWECWKKDTEEFVAAKVLKHSRQASREVGLMFSRAAYSAFPDMKTINEAKYSTLDL